MNDIGKQIKRLRAAKKITQSELAERVGVTKATISAYENNTRLPSYDVLIKLAYLFHVSVDNLLGYSNQYTIDVSALTQKQRNTVQEIVSTYVLYNFMDKNLLKSESIMKDLKSKGLVDPFENRPEE